MRIAGPARAPGTEDFRPWLRCSVMPMAARAQTIICSGTGTELAREFPKSLYRLEHQHFPRTDPYGSKLNGSGTVRSSAAARLWPIRLSASGASCLRILYRQTRIVGDPAGSPTLAWPWRQKPARELRWKRGKTSKPWQQVSHGGTHSTLTQSDANHDPTSLRSQCFDASSATFDSRRAAAPHPDGGG